MRLELDHIGGWRREDSGPARVYAVPGFAISPDVWLEVFPVVGRLEQSAEQVLLHGLPADAEIRRRPVSTIQSATGWTATVHEIEARAADGGLLEQRLLARYEVLVLAGSVLVRATNPARLEEHRADLLGVLQTARFDLAGDEPAGIADLWRM